MRFMILVKADKSTEAGVLPDERLLAEMQTYNEELVKAAILLAGEGLHPSSASPTRSNPTGAESEIEIRQVFEADDFGDNLTPELREREDRLRAELAKQQ